MAEDKNTHMFLSLIYMFQMQTMVQMGKLANPMTQKIEQEMEAAQVTIDMLDMLKEKTKGNLSEEESKFLEQSLADLKLNFVEEKSKLEKAGKASSEENINEVTEPEEISDSATEDNKGAESESEPSSK